MSKIANLKIKSMKLYFSYRDGLITLEDYQSQIRPLDNEIDKHEIKALSCYLEDTPALRRLSL